MIVVKAGIQFCQPRENFRTHSVYPVIASLSFLKEDAVWLNAFTTDIPRTYSTEALFISSRAFWYLPIFSFISPLPKPMNSATNARMIPTREARPNRQSTASRMMTMTMGAVIEATKSGNWWAIKPSTLSMFSSMIFRRRPLPIVRWYPSGILVIWSANRTFNSYSVPNAAMCELKIARKYSRIFATIPASASQP